MFVVVVPAAFVEGDERHAGLDQPPGEQGSAGRRSCGRRRRGPGGSRGGCRRRPGPPATTSGRSPARNTRRGPGPGRRRLRRRSGGSGRPGRGGRGGRRTGRSSRPRGRATSRTRKLVAVRVVGHDERGVLGAQEVRARRSATSRDREVGRQAAARLPARGRRPSRGWGGS